MTTANDSPAARAAALLREAGDLHHRVYRITDGDHEDWAWWYADWLVGLSELPEILGAHLVRSDLTATLLELDRTYAAGSAGEDWADYYAARLFDRYATAGGGATGSR